VRAVAPKQAYSRAETRRLLKITERQLKSWERQKLLPVSETYGFKELLALRTLLKLRDARVASPQIRRALTALSEKLRDIHDPLTQLKIYADGKRIRVDIDGRAMEAESGQLLLNFDAVELKRLLEFRKPEPVNADQVRRAGAEHWFQRGLEFEQTGAPLAEVIEAYQKEL
jgi:DNA-binding transcriptional MerR regulator